MSDEVTLLQLVDELCSEITMAKGIQAAIAGLKDAPLNDDMRAGVVNFHCAQIDQLVDIKNRLAPASGPFLRRFPDVTRPLSQRSRSPVGGSIRIALIQQTGSTRDPVYKKTGPQVHGPGQLIKGAVSQAHENPRRVIITSKAFQIVSVAATRPWPARFQPRPPPPSHGAAAHALISTGCR